MQESFSCLNQDEDDPRGFSFSCRISPFSPSSEWEETDCFPFFAENSFPPSQPERGIEKEIFCGTG